LPTICQRGVPICEFRRTFGVRLLQARRRLFFDASGLAALQGFRMATQVCEIKIRAWPVLLALTLVLAAGVTQAQTNFPARRIHMIVPYPAGGIVDIATRTVTNELSRMWHQPIIVEAKPTASGNLALDGPLNKITNRSQSPQNRPTVAG